MKTTNALLNHYLYEVEGKVVEVYESYIEDGSVIVAGFNRQVHVIPLLDYITFVFNSVS